MTSERKLSLAYEDRSAQAEVHKVVPVRELEEKSKLAFEVRCYALYYYYYLVPTK